MLKSPLLMVKKTLLLSLKFPRWPWLHFWATSLEPRQLGSCCGPGLCDCCCAPVSFAGRPWKRLILPGESWFFHGVCHGFPWKKTFFTGRHMDCCGWTLRYMDDYGWSMCRKIGGQSRTWWFCMVLYGLFEVAVQLVIGVIIEIQMGIPIHQTVEIGTVERE